MNRILVALLLILSTPANVPAQEAIFQTSDRCLACHSRLVTPAGEDVSIGYSWRPSAMANASRDPYWQAAVRRECLDHPAAAEAIEEECAKCHMPMAQRQARLDGHTIRVFENLPLAARETPLAALAADGVSCALCHQITPDRFGAPESFSANFGIDAGLPDGQRRVFGPYEVEPGLSRVMRSSSAFQPAEGGHIQGSELCATCHTLITHALGPKGEVLGTLPEQVPYLEWKHSAFAKTHSCPSCHMPEVGRDVPIASVLGQPREILARHTFRGGNFLLPRMLNSAPAETAVSALAQELDAAWRLAGAFTEAEAAGLQIEGLACTPDRLEAVVAVSNRTGHKLPTAYPSRRVWLHLTVQDRSGRVVFESGALDPAGGIAGNDNDLDPARFEPHHQRIENPDQVQIYESILGDAQGAVTTGLLRGVRYLKDNRLLPRGFDKATAPAETAVQGEALTDESFTAGGDRVAIQVPLPQAEPPFSLHAELLYQPVGFRWAQNLKAYTGSEPARFVRLYGAMAGSTALALARGTLTCEAKQ